MIALVACTPSATRPPVTMQPPIATSSAATPTIAPVPIPTAQQDSLPVTFALVLAEVPQNLPAYDRDNWRHWTDADGDCQNTRAEVLIAESLTAVTFDGCRVVSGSWVGLFAGVTGIVDAGSLDVDHMVPLANAHRSGGWVWDPSRKRAYANDLTDPGHLIAVTASANRSKGARGPEEWQPPNSSYRCAYATDWARIKDTWGLSVTAAELESLRGMLGGCPSAVQLVAVDDPGLLPEVPPTSTPLLGDGVLLYDPLGPDRDCGEFTQWRDAQRFYEGAGGPGSDPHRLDGNNDGVACESLPGAP